MTGAGPALGVARPLRQGETGDAALGGAVRLIQPARGYRFALDSILLARFAASGRCGGTAFDLGCGCGVVALCLLRLGAAERVVGVDLQPEFAAMAQRAAAWNGWQERASFVAGDLRRIPFLFPAARFDRVVANPPYRALGDGRVSPDPSIALARHEVASTVADVARAARHLLGRRGSLFLVYPARRLPSLLAACTGAGLAPVRLRTVHPREEQAASLVLLRCDVGAKGTLEVMAPLILHDAGGKRYAPEAEQLLGPP